MTGFKVIKDIDDKGMKRVSISSLTLAIGDLLELVGGATTWTETTATSAHFNRKAIVMETRTTANTDVLVYELDGTETVMAECTNTANATHNGDLMVLTDKNTVNNTGSTSTTEYATFIQDGIGEDTTHLVGRVLVGNGVNPDATT